MNVDMLKDKLKKHIEYDEYSEALNTVAELVKAGCQDGEVMYWAAYSYFMCGDYDRCASWLDNTLEFAPDHVAARILLARLCILEDKIDSGLAIFDFILENYEQKLSEDQNDEVSEILDYYGRSYRDKIKEEFPYIAAFLNMAPPPAPKVAPQAATVNAPAAASPEPVAAPVPAPQEAAAASPSALDEMRTILVSKSLSVKEKVRLLNVFAGGYFAAVDFKTAASFLNTAAELDPGDAMTLKNLAVLAHAMGRRDEAFAFAAKLPETDFALIAELMR